jgi:hypothetical protein
MRQESAPLLTELVVKICQLAEKKARRQCLQDTNQLLETQVQLADQQLQLANICQQVLSQAGARRRGSGRRLKPCWDARAGELWLGGVLVKRFEKVAPNQRRVLDEFQLQRWKREIQNPFREGCTNLNSAIETAKRTAENLNDDHETPDLIHFGTKQNGDYIRWWLGPAAHRLS